MNPHFQPSTFEEDVILLTEAKKDALEHAGRLHPRDRGGMVSFGFKLPGGKWGQESARVLDLTSLIPAIVGQDDTYLTVNRFNGARKIAALRECGALFADIDFYKAPGMEGTRPQTALDGALWHLEKRQIPDPSLAISSGRGLYIIWIHTPIPRRALPRWSACQRQLIEDLRGFGADPAAKDAARVLRLPGTRHSKTGTIVQTIRSSDEVYYFDDLAEKILPRTREEYLAEIYDIRAARAARSRRKHLGGAPRGYGVETLWATRLDDLQKIRKLRWFREPLPDFRDRWLFLSGVAMSWISPPEKMQRELYALAKEAGGWTPGKTKSQMHAVFRTTRDAVAGKKIIWNGNEIDPRYRFKSQTILEWLEITAEEERYLTTLISSDERRRRWRERDRLIRRAAGAKDRFSIAEQNKNEVFDRTKKGQSVRVISEALGLSPRRVKQIRCEIKETKEIGFDKPSHGG
jgi:hypothetical protein